MRKTLVLLFIFFASLGIIYAQEVPDLGTEQPGAPQEAPTKTKSTDNYYADPFSDMAELESQDEEEQEEALDRFYGYGRIFHVAIYGGMDYLRGPMSYIYHRGWLIGGQVSYFLDWDLTITFHTSIGKASMEFANPVTETPYPYTTFTGSATLFNLGFGLKYYFNFHDISRAIAYINPAINFGAEISIINDSLDMLDIPSTIDIRDPSHKMVAPGLFLGMSIEFPIFRKSIYLGADFTYHLSYFPAKNNKIPANDPHFGSLDYSGTYMTLGGSFIINL
jgi:hypothetical protein